MTRSPPFCDRNCNVIAPSSFPRPVIKTTRRSSVSGITGRWSRIAGSIGLDSARHDRSSGWRLRLPAQPESDFQPRQWCQTSTSIPEAENRRNAHCKAFFDAAIFDRKVLTRLSAWLAGKDKFRCLLVRFERLSQLHYAFKTTLAYAMINLRHCC